MSEMTPEAADAIADLVMADADLRGYSGGWKTPPSPAYHPCDIPPMTYADAARIWECPECGAEWTLRREHALIPASPVWQLPHAHVPGAREMVPSHQQPAYAPEGSAVTLSDERYAPTDLSAPAGESLPLPAANVTSLNEHSMDCAHRTGKGMCSCKVRLTV